LTKSTLFAILYTVKIFIPKGQNEMKEMKISLTTVKDIRNFVNEVILADYEVDLIQGRYTIDAKSIMGIFSLDLLSPITLVAHTENADALFAKLEQFKA